MRALSQGVEVIFATPGEMKGGGHPQMIGRAEEPLSWLNFLREYQAQFWDLKRVEGFDNQSSYYVGKKVHWCITEFWGRRSTGQAEVTNRMQFLTGSNHLDATQGIRMTYIYPKAHYTLINLPKTTPLHTPIVSRQTILGQKAGDNQIRRKPHFFSEITWIFHPMLNIDHKTAKPRP